MESWRTSEPQPVSWGYALAAAYGILLLGWTVSHAGRSCLSHLPLMLIEQLVYEMAACKLQAEIRAVLAEAVYRKSLKLHISEAEDIGTGALSSYESVDIERIIQATQFPYLLLHVSIAITVALYFLSIEMGVTVVSAIVSMVLMGCAIPLFSRHLVADMSRWSLATDNRVKYLASVLRCWTSIKFHNYEGSLLRPYENYRNKELQEQTIFKRRSALLNAFTVGVRHLK